MINNIYFIKKELTDIFVNAISPHIYEGLMSLYNEKERIYTELVKRKIDDIPTKIELFKMYLKDIQFLNENSIEFEANNIIKNSYFSNTLEDIFVAIIRCNFIVFNYKNNDYKYMEFKYFIHKCYMECAEYFYNNPESFAVNLEKIENVSRDDIINIIKKCIEGTILKILPIKHFIQQISNYYETYDKVNDDVYNDKNPYIDIFKCNAFLSENTSESENSFIDNNKESITSIDKTSNKINELHQNLMGGNKKSSIFENNIDDTTNNQNNIAASATLPEKNNDAISPKLNNSLPN